MDEQTGSDCARHSIPHRVDTEDRTLAEVRKALAQALRLLVHLPAPARLRDAIEETERALARLKEYRG